MRCTECGTDGEWNNQNRFVTSDWLRAANLMLEIDWLRSALERIAAYPKTRDDELGYEGCRKLARETLDT